MSRLARSRPGLSPPVTALLGLLLFLLSLLPRLAAIDVFITPDEPTWVRRSALFLEALEQSQPRQTFQSGHPGVTTMIIAALGMGHDNAREMASVARSDEASRSPGFLPALHSARVAFAVAGALFVPGMYLLAQALLGHPIALLAGLLLTLEPVFLGYSGLVHVDSLLAAFMSISLLSAILFWVQGRSPFCLALSGVAAGLAFLTKAPAALLVGFVPLVAVTGSLVQLRGSQLGRPGSAELRATTQYPPLWMPVAGQLTIWGLLASAVYFLLWPAMGVAPLETARSVVQYVESVGGSPHEQMNYFLGEARLDPGPLFYPVALALRLTPVTLLGLLALVVAAARQQLPRSWRLPLLLLAAYVATFVLMMTPAPKKFDRYLLPIFPVLELMAAAGFCALGDLLARRTARPWLAAGLATALALAQGASSASVFPYFTAYYSPVTGGPAVAQRVLLTGWGEGLDQVAAFLNATADAERKQVVARYDNVLAPLFRGHVAPPELYDPSTTDYVVLYVNQVQRGLDQELLDTYWGRTPEFVARVNGTEYAWVYRADRGQATVTVGADFGGLLRLMAYGLDRRQAHPGDLLGLTLSWELLDKTSTDWHVFAHLLDPSGRLVAQRDSRLGGDLDPTSRWAPGTAIIDLHRIQVPPDAPPGLYTLAVGVYDLASMQRLPVALQPAGGARYPDRVEIATVEVVE